MYFKDLLQPYFYTTFYTEISTYAVIFRVHVVNDRHYNFRETE